MKIFNHIKSILEQNKKFCENGKLFKNVVVEAGLKLDPELLALLLSDDTAKKYFFTNVNGVAVFDKVKFQKFVSNKQFLPDSYTAFKNKIGLTANGEYLTEANEVVLDFPYKDCVLEGGQTKEDQKREELFWNETLAPDEIDRLFEPKVLTNWKRYDKDGVHEVKSISLDDNLIIKGNNLIALHSLKKVYKGKVKLIYIDPPYNTGNDSFNYNDSFNHASWLTFMKNRLEVAKNILSNDGVIFVSCDDNEFAYLKVLMDGIFKQENFIEMFSWKKSDTPSNLPKKSKKVLEYILCYEKNRDNVKYKGIDKKSNSSNGLMNRVNSEKELIFPENIVETGLENGVYNKGTYGTDKYNIELLQDTEVLNGIFTKPIHLKGRFKWGQQKLDLNIKNKTKISIRTKSFSPSYEKCEYDIEAPINYIDSKMGVQTTENAGKDLLALFGKELFTYPKPETLIEYLINMVSNKLTKDDFILDFHLGSGTTCAVAHKLGYKYIGVEQLDYIEEITVNRMQKVVKGEQTGISLKSDWKGGGSFVYAELLNKNFKYIDKVKSCGNTDELIEVWKRIENDNDLIFSISNKSYKTYINHFKELDFENQKKVIIDFIDKNDLYVSIFDVDDENNKVNTKEKKINNKFYNLNA